MKLLVFILDLVNVKNASIVMEHPANAIRNLLVLVIKMVSCLSVMMSGLNVAACMIDQHYQ